MPRTPSPSVVVVGPASWNQLVVLDRLPEPVPHMQFALADTSTLGGTSAGKALHLAGLDVDTVLHALVADDDPGDRVRAALRAGAVPVREHPSERTERHLNLMTEAGERVSLYLATPSSPDSGIVDAIEDAVRAAELAVIDLSEVGAALVERRLRLGGETPIWTDLHDYDGASAFHEPFVRTAEVVFMNDDATDDPWALMQSCLDRGPRLAVCTLGVRGAIALTAAGERASTPAHPADVVDTNGAGDAFFAGFLAATLRGASLDERLDAGARQAVVALESAHLHPSVG
ncbi:sugar/nucleoside kinase (ribokinase family) [Microbacterium terrae]|uniref:5-dehydro-2-deoxygluconokinase n=1 Tax=Microbacterium terrae TaxID=69369 RepID=A0A0M2HEK9_9MICO|nr:PfkB family carbohydrate kinase [Microbacterium terrae]KJL42657.1 5-dehydro-2-deoxygluconokinase [Microbacterium terrae]MBP1079087.1 sugar/nucleoside kinase (ribokinase family) [Microbacterium terrae]